LPDNLLLDFRLMPPSTGNTGMDAAVQGLIANLAMVGVFASIWTFLGELVEKLPDWGQRVGLGLVMGLGAVAMMSVPVVVHPGLFLDLRVSLLAQAALFGGPLGAAVAVLLAGAYRIFLGGQGVLPGLILIALGALMGLGVRSLARSGTVERPHVVLLAFGALAVSLITLVLIPSGMIDSAVPHLMVSVPAIAFLATLLAGLGIHADEQRRRTERQNQTFRQVIETLPEAVNVKDLEGRFVIANAATARLMRAPDVSLLIGKTDFDFYPPETARDFREDELEVLRAGVSRELEQRLDYGDGTEMWLSTLKTPLLNDEGKPVALVTHNRDYTARKKLEQELERARSQLDGAMSGMADALIAFDRDANIIFCNDQYRRLFPMTADVRVPGRNLRDVLRTAWERGEQVDLSEEEVGPWIDEAVAGLRNETDREIHLADGRWLHSRVRTLSDGTSLSVISDVSSIKHAEEALSEVNKHLKQLAATDALTGLKNRRTFDELLAKEFSRSARHHHPLSALMIDVDYFKSFNDTYGHQAGDDAIRAVARCLKEVVRRPADIVARYGGEEFAVILPDTETDGAVAVGELICEAVRNLGITNGRSTRGVVTVSIGVATASLTNLLAEPEDLLRQADGALYLAKGQGRDGVQVYGEGYESRRVVGGFEWRDDWTL
jgi:diguanylate cyclase (GGDEF)-like protein/PAS domain S-box-containing protein